jgi:hypothetical protein
MENTTFDLAKELKTCTNQGKEIGYYKACNDIAELLDELVNCKLMNQQLVAYILKGAQAKREIYFNGLTNGK